MFRPAPAILALACIGLLAFQGNLGAQPSVAQVVIARGADILTADPTIDAYNVHGTVFVNTCDTLVAVSLREGMPEL